MTYEVLQRGVDRLSRPIWRVRCFIPSTTKSPTEWWLLKGQSPQRRSGWVTNELVSTHFYTEDAARKAMSLAPAYAA